MARSSATTCCCAGYRLGNRSCAASGMRALPAGNCCPRSATPSPAKKPAGTRKRNSERRATSTKSPRSVNKYSGCAPASFFKSAYSLSSIARKPDIFLYINELFKLL
nr:MAG: hypothetical protein [Molluscum contagiosum virus]